MSFEWQLCLGVIGLYLFDSTRMLYRNEVMFSCSGGRWHFHVPDDRWTLLGRSLYIPNPLTPHMALVRTSWSPFASGVQDASTDVLPPRTGLLRALVLVLFACMIMLLPLGLIYAGTRVFLLISVLVYALIVAMLFVLYLRRREWMLPIRPLLHLAFDALLCAPFAINTYRKLTLRTEVSRNAVTLANRMLDAEQLESFVRALIEKIDLELACCEDRTDSRGQALETYRNQLQAKLT